MYCRSDEALLLLWYFNNMRLVSCSEYIHDSEQVHNYNKNYNIYTYYRGFLGIQPAQRERRREKTGNCGAQTQGVQL